MTDNKKRSIAAVFSAVALTTLTAGCNVYIQPARRVYVPAPTIYEPPVVIVPSYPRDRHHHHHHHRGGRW